MVVDALSRPIVVDADVAPCVRVVDAELPTTLQIEQFFGVQRLERRPVRIFRELIAPAIGDWQVVAFNASVASRILL